MKHFDTGSIVTIIITLILFVMALFFTGLTHDILLEAGVFLVSVKVIMLSYKASKGADDIQQQLREIRAILDTKK